MTNQDYSQLIQKYLEINLIKEGKICTMKTLRLLKKKKEMDWQNHYYKIVQKQATDSMKSPTKFQYNS